MSEAAVRAAEDAFFAGLRAADAPALDRMLADDFLLVGVADGQVVPRAVLLDLIGSGQLRFLDIVRDPDGGTLRGRDGVVVAVGSTRMTMSFAGNRFTVDSRYTHVYVREGDRRRLLAAQGTPIA